MVELVWHRWMLLCSDSSADSLQVRSWYMRMSYRLAYHKRANEYDFRGSNNLVVPDLV